MAYRFAKDFGVFWFSENTNFTNPEKHSALLASIKAELARRNIVEMKKNTPEKEWVYPELGFMSCRQRSYQALR